MNDKQTIKPITVIREEFIESIINLINESNLPAFVIEPILKDMYNETKIASKKQYERDRKMYEEALKEELKNELKDIDKN